MNRNTILLLFAGMALGVGLGLALIYGLDARPQPVSPVETGPTAGQLAPDFTLQNLAGEPVALRDLRGKVVLINFWATWCGPCRVEMPALQSRFEKLAPDLVILAVNFDEPPEQVRAFAGEFGLTFPILLDPGGPTQKLYRILGYPTSLFVDREGIIQTVHIGVMTESQLDSYLKELGLNP